jgi:hypothetical protein
MASEESEFTQKPTFLQAGLPRQGPQRRSPEGADASAAGAPGAGPTTGGFTVGGARIRQSDKARQRYAWMYDDEDIWGADSVQCIPPVINGDDWRAPKV